MVTLIAVSLNTSLTARSRSGFMIKQHFLTLGSNQAQDHSLIVHPIIFSRLAENHFRFRHQQTNTVLLRLRGAVELQVVED